MYFIGKRIRGCIHFLVDNIFPWRERRKNIPCKIYEARKWSSRGGYFKLRKPVNIRKSQQLGKPLHPSLLFNIFVAQLYRDRVKGVQIMLSNSQAGPDRKVKQEQEEISRNHVQAF